MRKIIGGRDFRSDGIGVIGIFIGIDQYRFADRVQAAVLEGRDQVRGIFVVGAEQQSVAMRQCLHIAHFEGLGELRSEVRVTPGNIEGIRVVRIGDQLEEIRPGDLPRGAQLDLLVIFELLTEEDGGEEAERIGIFVGRIGIDELTAIVGAFGS